MPSRPLPVLRLSVLLVGLALSGAACGEDDPLTGRRDASQALSRGRDLYVVSCSLCHGSKGDGRGARAATLVTPPTDFTDPEWQAQAEAEPRIAYRAIREGVEGTAMPAWPAFSEDETWDLVAYLLSVDEDAPAE